MQFFWGETLIFAKLADCRPSEHHRISFSLKVLLQQTPQLPLLWEVFQSFQDFTRVPLADCFFKIQFFLLSDLKHAFLFCSIWLKAC